MTPIRAHFDGKVIVPDQPVDLPRDEPLVVYIERATVSETGEPESVLDWILTNPIHDCGLPTDLSHQHDHYLYGTPKKPT